MVIPENAVAPSEIRFVADHFFGWKGTFVPAAEDLLWSLHPGKERGHDHL